MTFIVAELIDNSREIKSTESYDALIEFLIEHYPKGFDKSCDISVNGIKVHLDDYGMELKEEDIIVLLMRPGITAAMVGGSMLLAMFANVAISMAISYVMQSLFAPDEVAQDIESIQQQNKGSGTYNLNSSQNQAKLGSPIPIIYGTVRTTPAMIMEPYKQVVDNVEYLNHLLCIGQGEYILEDIFIDKTSVLNHPDVEYCLLEGSDFNNIPNAVNTKLGYNDDYEFTSDVVEVLSTPSNYELKTFKMAGHVKVEYRNWNSTDKFWRQAKVFVLGSEDYSAYDTDSVKPEVGDLLRVAYVDPHTDIDDKKDFYGKISHITESSGSNYPGNKKYTIYDVTYTQESYVTKPSYGFQGKADRVDTYQSSNYIDEWDIQEVTDVPGATHRVVTGSNGVSFKSIINSSTMGLEVNDSTSGDRRFGCIVYYNGNDGNEYGYVRWVKGTSSGTTNYYYFERLGGYFYLGTALGWLGTESVYTTVNFSKTSNEFHFKKENEVTQKAVATYNLPGGFYKSNEDNGKKIPIIGPKVKQTSMSSTDSFLQNTYFDNTMSAKVDNYTKDCIIYGSGNPEIFKFSTSPIRPQNDIAGDTERVILKRVTKFLNPVSHNDYGNIQLLFVRMKATNAISSIGQMKVNVLVTRDDKGNRLMDVLRDIYTNTNYGAGLSYYDLQFPNNGGYERVHGSYDSMMTVYDAMKTVSSPHKYSVTPNGRKIEIKKDDVNPYGVALYNEYNIIKDSFKVDLIIQDVNQQYDCYKVSYRDSITFEEKFSYYPFQGYKPKTIKTFGVVQSSIAYDYAKYQWLQFFSRKKTITFDTDIQGLIPNFKDKILVSHNTINWGLDAGQVLEVNGRVITTTSDVPHTNSGGTMFFKMKNGKPTSSYGWSVGLYKNKLRLDRNIYSNEVDVDSYYTLGTPKEFLVTDIKPKGDKVSITAVNYDESIYS